LLLDPACLDEVRDAVTAEDFYDPRHRLIFRAALEVDAAGGAIDTVMVACYLRRDDRLEQSGGAAYLAEIIDATPAVSHVVDHARIVANLARQRGVVAVSQRIAAEGYEHHNDVPWWLAKVDGEFAAAIEVGETR